MIFFNKRKKFGKKSVKIFFPKNKGFLRISSRKPNKIGKKVVYFKEIQEI